MENQQNKKARRVARYKQWEGRSGATSGAENKSPSGAQTA
jgi:hypothetical protein